MKIDLEDLRAELNDFSPEQQREKEIKTIERSMVALTNVTSELGKYLTQMEHLAWEINNVNEVRISAETKQELCALSEKMGTDASVVFEDAVNKNVIPVLDNLQQTLERIKQMNTRVSLPLSAAYFILADLLCSIAYSGVVTFANYRVIHSEELWSCTWLMLGVTAFLVSGILFLNYKKWL